MLQHWVTNRVSPTQYLSPPFYRLHRNDRINGDFLIDLCPLHSKFTVKTRQLTQKLELISGVKVTLEPCCKVGKTGGCIPNSAPCANRNDYSYFDLYHPSERSNLHGSLKAYNSTEPLDVYPMNLQKLALL